MGVFSIVLLFILSYIFFNKDNLKKKYLKYVSLLMIIEILVLNASFINIGGLSISVKYIMDIFLLVYTVYFIYKENIRINKKMFCLGNVFLLLIIIGILSEMIYPYDNYIINYDVERGWDRYILGEISKEPLRLSFQNIFLLYLKIIVYVLTTYVIKTICNKHDLIYLLHNILKYTRFIIVYGFIEYIIKNLLNMLDIIQVFQEVVFFNIGQVSTVGSEVYRLVGVSSEPSHFIYCLYMLIVLRLISKKIINYNSDYKQYINVKNIDIILMIFLMVLSGGFSAVWYLTMLGLIFIVLKYDIMKFSFINKIKLITGIFLFCTSILLLMFYLSNMTDLYVGERLYVAFNTINYLFMGGQIDLQYQTYLISNLARIISIYDVIGDFINRPLLGLGIGVQTAHGGLAMLLSDFGLLGIYFLFRLALYKMDKSVKYDMIFLFIFFIIANLLMGLKSIAYEIYNILFIEITRLYYEKNLNISGDTNEKDSNNNIS